MGIFGIVLGGWASNSHYSLLGALRSSAQLVSYETAAGMAVISGLLLAGTLSTRRIVELQAQQGVWFVLLAPVGFFIYLVASMAETNRTPFDLPEAESELVAGYLTEYSGFRWVVYMMAEYANMIVVASIATTLFLGGWLRPFSSVRALDFLDYTPMLVMLLAAGYCFWRTPRQPVNVQKGFLAAVGLLCLLLAAMLAAPLFATPARAFQPGIHGAFWFLLKVFLYIYVFLWLRFTVPRYRFDQLMRLGWHFMIPVAIANVMGVGLALVLHRQFGWGLAAALVVTTVGTLVVAAYLAAVGQRRASPVVGGA